MTPGKALREFIVSYVEQNLHEERLKDEIPKKWEKYGDFVLFDERTFRDDVWKSREIEFWLKISGILKCKRIGLKSKIKNDGFRTPNVTIVLGTDPWISHRDNMITYTWNVEKSMFSAGNVYERHRVGKLDCVNEVVVDLFAGIGYFTLPFLIHSKASFVHACEWNPTAVEALKRNLTLNKVQNKCAIHEGDNLLVCPKKVAHRVHLGLIPTSEDHWKVACEALLDTGGILHIHENVETKSIRVVCSVCSNLISQINSEICQKGISITSDEFIIKFEGFNINWKHHQWYLKGVHILHSILSLLLKLDTTKVWSCSVNEVNFVKSYAPHVQHLVYDVKVKTQNLNKT